MMKASELIEKAMMLYHSLTISNVGDCLTPYKVKIKHYSATVEATSHSLVEALALASAKMEEYYPGITERFDGNHKGDPCQWCGVPHDDVEVGPCKGVGINEKPDPLTWREFAAILVDPTKYGGQMRPWWLCTDPKLQQEMLVEADAQFAQWKANELDADKKRKVFDAELYGGEE